MSFTIGHIVSCYLPVSETFTYDLIRSIPDTEHRIFTTATENVHLFPHPHVITAGSEEEFARLARVHDVDVLVGHFGPNGLTAMQIGLLSDVPSITIFHGYDISLLLRDERWLERYRALFRFGTHMVSVSEAGRQRLIRVGASPDRISTLHLGVDVDRFAYRRQRATHGRPRNILMVARLTEKKGILTALHALAIARTTDPGLRLCIIGEGEERDRIEAAIAALRLEGIVELMGARSADGVRDALRRCHILLQPSVTAANGDQEGIPVALMEAMACGVPVIATRHSGIPELVIHERTGLLADERDASNLADQIRRLTTDRDVARRMTRQARLWVEQEFNLARQAPAFGALVRRVAARHEDDQVRRTRPASTTDRQPRVLFLRSVPVPSAWSALAILARRHPEAHVSVLTSESTVSLFERLPFVSEVHGCPGDRLVATALPPQTLSSLRAAAYDRVIVPYANVDGAGYDNVREVALGCGGAMLVEMPRCHTERIVPPGAWDRRGSRGASGSSSDEGVPHALGA